MMTAVQPYLDLILKERSWSWAVVCLLYILAGLFVRSWFVSPLMIQMKMIEKKHLRHLKTAYLRQSLLGWLFFFLPLLVIATYWNKESFPVPLQDHWLILIGFLSFVLSVILHLQSLGVAALEVVESLEKEKAPEA
jgi:hypothetical protein